PMVVLPCGAIFLTLMEYWGSSAVFRTILENYHFLGPLGALQSALLTSPFSELCEFVWWSAWRVLGYLVLPCLTLRMVRQPIVEYGLRIRGFWGHAWIYGICYAAVLLLVVLVSFTDEFSTYYPFYKLAGRSWIDFLAWEVLYAAQFFSLEFFFRGYWLVACK